MFMLIMLFSGLTLCQTQPAQVQDTNAVKKKPAEEKSDQTPKGEEKKQATKTSSKPTVVKKKVKEVANMASINLSSGRTNLNVKHWPSIGNPKAKYVFVEMFDYTCSHCKNTHRAIDGAIKKYKDDLAIVVLPVPVTNNAAAGEVARIAVAVWRCKPSTFHKFHDWMFASPVARTAFEARQFGEKLVGADKLRAEMAKPYAGQYVSRHKQLYQRAGAGQVPKLMFPRATMVGEVSSPTTLVNMIERQLGPRKQ